MDKHITIWTCDRCGTEQRCNPSTQPQGWYAILLISPPRAEVEKPREALCRDCMADFSRWKRAGSVRADDRSQAVSA